MQNREINRQFYVAGGEIAGLKNADVELIGIKLLRQKKLTKHVANGLWLLDALRLQHTKTLSI